MDARDSGGTTFADRTRDQRDTLLDQARLLIKSANDLNTEEGVSWSLARVTKAERSPFVFPDESDVEHDL